MTDLHTIVQQINTELPVHSLWDGFWISEFKQKNLVLSGSFDKIYYRDYDLVFKKVRFFNLPHRFADTAVPSDHLLRLATAAEFAEQFPDFVAGETPIFAIDLQFSHYPQAAVQHTFFVLAERVYLFRCQPPNNDYMCSYTDPFIHEYFPCKKNRVL